VSATGERERYSADLERRVKKGVKSMTRKKGQTKTKKKKGWTTGRLKATWQYTARIEDTE